MSKKKEVKKDLGTKELVLPFNGSLAGMNGVTNERELAAECPDKFSMMNNEWLTYAHHLLFGQRSLFGWKWKSNKEDVRNNQYKLFIGIFESHSLTSKEKARILAWMASEMISEIPTS